MPSIQYHIGYARFLIDFFSTLLSLADLKEEKSKKASPNGDTLGENEPEEDSNSPFIKDKNRRSVATGLHYNIQIHLPATKDSEVYNAIFKSLREHLLEE